MAAMYVRLKSRVGVVGSYSCVTVCVSFMARTTGGGCQERNDGCDSGAAGWCIWLQVLKEAVLDKTIDASAVAHRIDTALASLARLLHFSGAMDASTAVTVAQTSGCIVVHASVGKTETDQQPPRSSGMGGQAVTSASLSGGWHLQNTGIFLSPLTLALPAWLIVIMASRAAPAPHSIARPHAAAPCPWRHWLQPLILNARPAHTAATTGNLRTGCG